MKKLGSLLLLAVFVTNSIFAQGIAEGMKMLDYDKHKTAADIFKKLYDANSKDPQNIYWYGQAFMAVDNFEGAKAVYQKALQEGINDPFILVGMGHVELMQGGDVNAAKQKFEQAITMGKDFKGKSKTKNYALLLDAIGRANADGGTKIGDPTYGIDKLKEAASLDPTNADIMINMGISYLKMGADEGGDAVKAYMDAANREPKNPLPYYKIGRIYQSQNNKDLFEENYNKVIEIDPSFPPVYLSLYNYYAFRDVSKAKDYIEKFIQYADKDCEVDYFFADYLFRAGKYQESLDKAKADDAGDCKTYYRNSLLFAYNYDRLGDSLQAKAYIEKYFANAPTNKIISSDFDIAVTIFSKIAGQESTAISYLQKGIDNDSSVANKVKYCNQAAEIMGKAKKYSEQIKWLQKGIQLKGGSMGEADYYKLASTAFAGKDYAATMEVSKQYINAFPEKPQGYSFNVRAAKNLDTSSTLGTAIEPMTLQNDYLNKQDSILSKDSIANKKALETNTNILYRNLCYMMSYYNDVLKDVPKAINCCEKIIALYPDATSEQNKFAVHIKEVLQKSSTKPTGGKPSGTTKPQK